MVATVKSRSPHVLPAMTSRRRSSPAATSVFFRPLGFVQPALWGSLLVLGSLFLVLALSVSAVAAAAAEECAEESGVYSHCLGFRDVCADRNAFCFSSSTVQELLASEDGTKEPDLVVSRDWGPSRPLLFRMPSGGVVTCSSADALITRARNGLGLEGKEGERYNAASCHAPLVPDNWMRAMTGVPPELDSAAADANPNGLYGSSSMNVEIIPPVLDWGKSSLYATSMATLTVVNLNNDSTLRVYEPFSTDPQFYVYGYDDLVLQPRENASVTFIFLPKLLGSSSAHLVLQTNFGGFIIQAKGMAVGSPYKIQPLTGMDVIMGGHLERNLSISNPFDDSLYVEEVAIWMSAFEDTKRSSHIVCQLGPFDESLESTSLSSKWYATSSIEFGWPMVQIRPEELSANSRTGSLGSIIEGKGLHYLKPTITRADKADDTVLRRWKSHGRRTGISVLTDQELSFPIVQVGSQFSKWITIHNPSLEHVSVQLVLNSEEIIGQCKTVNDACEHTFSSRSPEINSTETRFGFSLSDTAITDANIDPSENALLGPVIFRPSNTCMWSSMVLIRSNLSGIEWLPLRAHGGRQSIVLLEESEPVWKLEFNLTSNVQNKSTLSKLEISSPLCSQQLSKEIHVKNSGDLPLQVTKVKISGADCGVDGFMVDYCKGFSLAPDESMRMYVSFKADFSSAKVQRDLELAMTTGIFIIPMTANIPVCMLNQCRKSYLRSIHWKALILILGTVFVFVLMFVGGVPTSLSMGSQDYYIKIHDRKSTINKAVKPSFLEHSSKTSRSTREQKRSGETPNNKYPADIHDSPKRTAEDKTNPDEQLNTALTISMPPSNHVEDKISPTEAPETSGNLTIRVARDKGRRRKRKVGGAGLAAKLEASSSHSGNSTPSSPGSDIEARAPSTTSKTDDEKNAWLQTGKEQPSAPPPVTSGEPSPSASVALPTNAARRSPLLGSPSPIAPPHARAPGSNLVKDKAAVKRSDQGAMLKKDFTYDIWGDHFSGHLLGKAREVAPCKMFAASEGASNSFFATEPQALVTKPPSAPPPATRRRGSMPPAVASGYGIN
ncbi:hypothetical protein GUJ93_ZPchr0013g35276 [Zizania palustris]|uniref:Transmembrane protein 131-like N-terminal domain-containing protein n=1 Tax=Zizania palustris TaxID=103762 RepID=A0A8J5WSR7_ZIZPA|nr:hypothetical protein GUJ93_ZPchr0013g35276 [Zizania palustris]